MPTRMFSGILFVLLLVSVSTGTFNIQSAKANASSRGEVVQAADTDWWPMFHHDLGRTGTSTSTAPTTNRTLWNYTTRYMVASSPAVEGGRVYVGSADSRVYCLDAATGALVWNCVTGQIVHSSPAVADGKVYVGAYDSRVYCLDATTGVRVWNYATGGYLDSSPAVADDMVFVGSSDGNVYALNASNGALMWSFTTGDVVDSSPAVADGVVYVGSYDGKVYAFGLIHDVAVSAVTLSTIVVSRGYNANINVTVANQGGYPETFNATTYANTTIIASQNVTLPAGNSTTVTFTWNTTGFAYGNYTISAYAFPVPGETDTANNNCTSGVVAVTILGDINGDFEVNLDDLVLLAVAYGSRPGDPNWNSNADLALRGIIDLTDLVTFAMHYGQHYP